MECIYKLSELLSSISALVLEIVIGNSQCWCLWEFDDEVFVFLILWEAHYPQEFNVSGTVVKMLVHTPINSTWTISPEFWYAQALIVWAIWRKLVVLIFDAITIKISWMRDPFVELWIYCYKVSAFTLCVSNFFTFVSVRWNHIVDHYVQTTLYFAPDFPVKEEALIEKHSTAVFSVGVLTVIMSFFGLIFFLSEIISLKLQSLVKVQRVCIVVDKES